MTCMGYSGTILFPSYHMGKIGGIVDYIYSVFSIIFLLTVLQNLGCIMLLVSSCMLKCVIVFDKVMCLL